MDVRASGLPAQELLAAAAEAGADLVVVGSRGQNMVRQLFLGSTAREVIRESALPVLLEWIEPTPEESAARCELVRHRSLARLVIATDFSRRARPAEEAAITLCRAGTAIASMLCTSPRPTPSLERRPGRSWRRRRSMTWQSG
jgi:hypothetical protein